jgi:hypothetical protein
VWSRAERRDWFADDAETVLHWREKPSGQHIELGIAEVNLVSLLGELGVTWSRWGQPLLPIGVLYDPFVERALEPWSYGIYAGGQSILVGTPSGVSLAPEGGAHQSIKTPSIGLEQPGCVSYEPAFAVDTEWALLASLGRLGVPGGSSAYLRLSTRPVDQSLAAVPADPAARERRRRQVVAGGYPLCRAESPTITVAAMGAVVPEALVAAARLQQLGIPLSRSAIGLLIMPMPSMSTVATSPGPGNRGGRRARSCASGARLRRLTRPARTRTAHQPDRGRADIAPALFGLFGLVYGVCRDRDGRPVAPEQADRRSSMGEGCGLSRYGGNSMAKLDPPVVLKRHPVVLQEQ